MNRPTIQRIVALLSVLLLGCVSLFGSTLGYECRCTGRAALVAVDHCHGPHGDQCLDGDAPSCDAATHGENGGPSDNENTERHAAVQKDADGLPRAALTTPAIVPSLLAVLPAIAGWNAPPSQARVASTGPSACRPPPSIESARTVVLLI